MAAHRSTRFGGTSPGRAQCHCRKRLSISYAYEDVGVQGANTNNNVVQGNLIGLNAAGTARHSPTAIPESEFTRARRTIPLAAPRPEHATLISGHADYGVYVSDLGTNGNVVQGNTIGLNIAGSAVANGGPGVAFVNNAQSNVLGGSATGASNTISGNTGDGVAVDSSSSTTINETFSRNSIFANGGKGISLSNGGNNSQPFPNLSSAVLSTVTNPSGTDVAGALTAAASTAYTIEFFASATGDPSGFGEGRVFRRYRQRHHQWRRDGQLQYQPGRGRSRHLRHHRHRDRPTRKHLRVLRDAHRHDYRHRWGRNSR